MQKSLGKPALFLSLWTAYLLMFAAYCAAPSGICQQDSECNGGRCEKGQCTAQGNESTTPETQRENTTTPEGSNSEHPIQDSGPRDTNNLPEISSDQQSPEKSEPSSPETPAEQAPTETTPEQQNPTRTCPQDQEVNPKLSTPKILEVKADDRLATLYWNSKTAVYDRPYDPDGQAGIDSYLVEWGEVGQSPMLHALTTARVINLQPLLPGKTYQATVYNLDAYGRRSAPSKTVTFQHDPTRVDQLRKQMNGFFSDFNQPMGPFDEREWNNAYSGCVGVGEGGQFINPQFHAHNVLASLQCDRGVTNSRVREMFDFRGRTGTIVFDVDGAVRRNIFYLDLLPWSRKRDITGHVALDDTNVKADPPNLVRFLQSETRVALHVANSQGQIRIMEGGRNGACGGDLRFCKGENLQTIKNVRRRYRIQISKTRYQAWINDVLVLDVNLDNNVTPGGLPFEQAHVIWLHFSYNTPKANLRRALLHWDNFGFDAPAGYQPKEVIHNYTNGLVGPQAGRGGGPETSPSQPYKTTIPIPNALAHTDGAPAQKAELMFTMQGAFYKWNQSDTVTINGHVYPVPEPTSQIAGMSSSQLVDVYVPHSVLMPIKPEHLKQGNNDISFQFGPINVFNLHIELTFDRTKAPKYTQPTQIFATYPFMPKAVDVGPGITFTSIDKEEAWTFEGASPRGYRKLDPIQGSVKLALEANSQSEITTKGTASGTVLYDLLVDRKIHQTVRLDRFTPVAGFYHELTLDTKSLCNGVHELALWAYNKNGAPSTYDAFQSASKIGEYYPTFVTVNNAGGTPCDASNSHISGPTPTPRKPEDVKQIITTCPPQIP